MRDSDRLIEAAPRKHDSARRAPTPKTLPSESAAVEPLLISIKDMQTMLGISRDTAYTLVSRGAVESRYIGRRRLVVLASFREYVERLPTTPPSA